MSSRYILNDTYRTELCLLYPPHLIAIAALFIAFSHIPPPPPGQAQSKPIATISKPPSRVPTPESRPSTPQLHPSLPQRPTTIMQPTLSRSVSQNLPPAPTPQVQAIGKVDPLTFLSRLNVSLPLVLQIVQQIIPLYTLWNAYETEGRPKGTAGGTPGRSPMPGGVSADEKVVKLLSRIRGERMNDLAHPASGRPSAVPKHVK